MSILEQLTSDFRAAAVDGIDAIKKVYFRAALRHHPDRGGDLDIMKEINELYHNVLESLNGRAFSFEDASGKDRTYTYHYNQKKEQSIIDKINETFAALGVVPNVALLLVGTWLWIEGETRPHKETLKALKYRWHSKRGRWYWHTPQRKRRFNSKASFADICSAHGCEEQQRASGQQSSAPAITG